MTQIAIVTDADQGLGPGLVRGLCRRPAALALQQQVIVYITTRDRAAGRRAAKELRAHGLVVRPEPLDVRDTAGVAALAATLAGRHGGVDVVIANATAQVLPGVRYQDQVRAFVDVNNHGLHRVITSFGPLLREGGRFVVMSSPYGDRRHLPYRLRTRFDAEHMSLTDLERVMDEYVARVEDDSAAAEGWPSWIAVPSRVGQVTAVRVMARDLAEEDGRRDITVNATCTGMDDPDWPDGPDSIRATADALWLATLPPGSPKPNGELIKDRKPI
jgi:carbonyl reductase 1